MNWRRGKIHNLRFLLTVANWNPTEPATPLVFAERVAHLEEDARCDPGLDSPRNAKVEMTSVLEGRLLAIADDGHSQWIVGSTPFDESGTALQARDPVVPEVEKRSRLSSYSSTLCPSLPTHTTAHDPKCECIGKRRRRWRIRQSHPRRKPYKRPTGLRRWSLKSLKKELCRELRRCSGAYRQYLQSASSLVDLPVHTVTPKHAPEVTTTSNARNQCGWPGPKSALRLLLFHGRGEGSCPGRARQHHSAGERSRTCHGGYRL